MARTPKNVVKEPETVHSSAVSFVDGLPAAVKGSPQALLVLHLADVLSSTTSARDVAVVSRELRAAIVDVGALVNSIPDRGDFVDEIRARRDARANFG